MHVLKRPKLSCENVSFGKITGSRACAREPVNNELDEKQATWKE